MHEKEMQSCGEVEEEEEQIEIMDENFEDRLDLRICDWIFR